MILLFEGKVMLSEVRPKSEILSYEKAGKRVEVTANSERQTSRSSSLVRN